MPRVLCVTSNLPRWAGDSTTPFVLHLAQDLQALGWEIDLLAPHAPGARRHERLGGVAVRRFRYLWPESAETVCYQGGALVNLRKSPMNNLKLPALVAAELAAVIRELARERYDLVHSHWILPQGFTGMLAAALFGKPHVVTVHGGDLFALKARPLAALKSLVLSRADAVSANSSFTAAGIRALCANPKRLERIAMGVRTDPLTNAQQRLAEEIRAEHRRGTGPLLLFLGRLVEEKGLRDLLDALSIIAPARPDLRLLVLGEGQDHESLRTHAEAIGVAAQVRFLGWVGSEQVPAYLAAADTLVGPSKRAENGWMEAQGLVFAEAMAVGTPVVATRHGGIPDTVVDGETGLLVPEASAAALATAIEQIAEDPDLARRLTAAGLELVRGRLSRAATAEAFSRLFASLIR